MGRFNGEYHPIDWVLQMERYFFVYSISNSLKLPLAAICLVDDARDWFRGLYHTNQFRDWDDFVDKLFIQFRSRTRAPFAINRQHPVALNTQPLSSISNSPLPQFCDELLGCSNETDAHKLLVAMSDMDTDVEIDDTVTNDLNTCVTDGGNLATVEGQLFDEIPQRDSSIAPSQIVPTNMLMIPSLNLHVSNDIVAMELTNDHTKALERVCIQPYPLLTHFLFDPYASIDLVIPGGSTLASCVWDPGICVRGITYLRFSMPTYSVLAGYSCSIFACDINVGCLFLKEIPGGLISCSSYMKELEQTFPSVNTEIQASQKSLVLRHIGVHVTSTYVMEEINEFCVKMANENSRKAEFSKGLFLEDKQYLSVKATNTRSHPILQVEVFVVLSVHALTMSLAINVTKQQLQVKIHVEISPSHHNMDTFVELMKSKLFVSNTGGHLDFQLTSMMRRWESLYLNLEDKVLIERGGIVMNISKARSAIGLRASNSDIRSFLRLIWDPGPNRNYKKD